MDQVGITMNRNLSAVEIFPRTWDTSRDYFVQLADLDKEQARMESRLEGGTVAEHHRLREALRVYREMLSAMWERDNVI